MVSLSKRLTGRPHTRSRRPRRRAPGGADLPLHEFGSRLSAPIAIPIVILPLANHDNNQHAENENIRLQNLWDAMRIYWAVLAAFGER
jgi:acetylornithine deacetylase/succinyl-diaminopimelate desuccinylase-like protein